ncbi:ribonuclease T2 [Rhizobium subbaraonis]|uniref:Ribonuclease T2 n=1 Tax=Rhizobium subbaraonis TaxID=908946 RepID=A0A285UEG1_9HYPH|nr:ribonuclease [Rhizobium subbaraonis]SOC40334.1 ribonuclease T2 [Rhizobium subbaraonis]
MMIPGFAWLGTAVCGFSGRVLASFVFSLAITASGPALSAPLPVEAPEGATRHVLALSWQPGYCMVRPNAAECEKAGGQGLAPRLGLHGLWQVKKSYCGIDAELKKRDRSRNWDDLPKLALSDGTQARLAAAMPGVATGLDRHQWLMHGTCHAATAEDYFSRALDMLEVVNRSAVGAFFTSRSGKIVTISEVGEAFNGAFGAGAGDRVRLRCRSVDGKEIVTGVTIGLAAVEGELSGLVLKAAPTKQDCKAGLLAAAGGQ